MSSKARRMTLAGLLAITGCTSQAPVVSVTQAPVTSFEQNALDALATGDHETTHQAIVSALAVYQRQDNIAGQWRMQKMLVQDALRYHPDAVTRSLAELGELTNMLDDRRSRYAYALLQGRATDDVVHYSQALALAQTPIQRAVSLTYLGRHTEAMASLNESPSVNPADRAFVLYNYGAVTEDENALQQALTFYRRANDPRGMADCLMRLALMNQTSDPQQATEYAQRAARTLTAGDYAFLAEQVNLWLEQQR